MDDKVVKVFISIPFKGRTDEAIKHDIHQLKNQFAEFYLKKNLCKIKFVDNFIEKPADSERLYCLGEAIKKLGDCDIVIFGKDFHKADGCMIEYEVAWRYGIKMYEQLPYAFHLVKS